ncbi:MAG: amino acid ABC transporter permease [Syntrophobacteraceae bacterium]
MLHYDFDWSVLWRHPYGTMLLQGVWTTVHLSLLSWMIALFIGLLIALCRIMPYRPARFLGGAYVEILRNIPLLVQLFFWYFAVPSLLPKEIERWLCADVRDLAYCLGVLALGTYTGARVAEALRSGLLAVPAGQFRAALSTGLSPAKTYRYVIMPYAFRVVIPLLSTEFLTCFKNSSLAMTIGVMEITGMANYIDAFTFHGLETTTAASLVYLVTSLSIVLFIIGLREFLRRVNLVDTREARSIELNVFAGSVYLVLCFLGSMVARRFERRREVSLS